MSSEQKVSHFFRITSKTGISVMALSLRGGSSLRALISLLLCMHFLKFLLLFQYLYSLFVGILFCLRPTRSLLWAHPPLPC